MSGLNTSGDGYQHQVIREPADELRNQLQNILAVSGTMPDLLSRTDRIRAQEVIEAAALAIMEKVGPALTDERTE